LILVVVLVENGSCLVGIGIDPLEEKFHAERFLAGCRGLAPLDSTTVQSCERALAGPGVESERVLGARPGVEIVHPGVESERVLGARPGVEIAHPGVESERVLGARPGVERERVLGARPGVEIVHPGVESERVLGARPGVEIAHPGVESERVLGARPGLEIVHPGVESERVLGARLVVDFLKPSARELLQAQHGPCYEPLHFQSSSCPHLQKSPLGCRAQVEFEPSSHGSADFDFSSFASLFSCGSSNIL
jgi:hypothetical protein